MRTEIDVTRMKNDVIIGVGDALSKQPCCRQAYKVKIESGK